ncbi:MAG: deoxynucleoside kinase [bacterium]
MKFSFITIEGNIGAGKTTLANILSNRLNARLVLEEFADNPFLPKFYENPSQYAFPLELFFMAERYKQHKDLVAQQDLFQNLTISDYLFSKCLLYAKVNLAEDEFKLFQRLFDIIHQELVTPDLLIYLHSPIDRLQQNIRKRNRPYEQSIQNEYLQSIQETYTNYLKRQHIKTLFVDAGNADFINNEAHVDQIIQVLHQDLSDGHHYLTLS